jgi:hypothetical protein
MSTAYRGPNWPLSPILTTLYSDLHQGYQQLQDDLRVEHARKAKAIAEDANLSQQGKQGQLAQLAEAFRHDKRVKAFEAELAKARARESQVRSVLTKRTPPKPQGDAVEVAAAMIERSFSRHRTLERYERLAPEAKREATWRALDATGAGDAAAAEFLSALRDEPGLLDAQVAAKVDAALMKRGNPTLVGELEQLAGKLQVDGQHDVLTSAVRCAADVLRCYHEYLDQAVGIAPGARDVQAIVDAATGKDGNITLTPEAAHDHAVYVLARDRTAAGNKELRISGPEGDSVLPGEMMPITPNGQGGE